MIKALWEQMVLSRVMVVRRFEYLASSARSVAEPRPINGAPRKRASDGRVVEKPARGPAGLNWLLEIVIIIIIIIIIIFIIITYDLCIGYIAYIYIYTHIFVRCVM